ncbi:MAG: MoaD/ThiS family protein [Gemmatimonadota bacterium]|nr:MoaD/ThiS family protein [Gemmatimonadota bacterium]
MPTIQIRLPAALSDRAAGASTVSVEATSVSTALSRLAARHPDLERLVFDPSGELRPHVHLFLGARQVRAEGEDALTDGDELRIVPSIAGG